MLPSRLGPYRIVRKVGRGGMGTVYMGVDDASGQTAAVKLLAADMAQQADFRDRFKAEIETLRKLNHPNIVQIFGFGEEDEQIFYAMEFVAGSSLEEQIGRGRAFPWREVAQFGIAVARALRHAHDRGVIHRDIKPGNLLLTEEGVLKLSDFGIARLFGSGRLTGVGSVLGTAEFMAPEQAEGRPVDPRSDLYSLGGVLYVLLARRPLYNARSFAEMLDKQRFEKPAPLRQFAADIPVELEQIIHRLLEKDPERRFGTATVLERRLETMLESFACRRPRRVTVDRAGRSGGSDPPPVDPLAQTIAATQARDHAALPIAPAAVQVGLPEAGIGSAGKELPAESSASRGIAATGGPFRSRPARRARPGAAGAARRRLDFTADRGPGDRTSRRLAAGLVLLQPPSADALYRRIQRQTAGESADALQQAEDDIHQFLARFPNDPRSEGLKDYAERIEIVASGAPAGTSGQRGQLLHASLSPVERSYLDALNTARVDPEAGIAKLQAMIDLFESPKDVSGPTLALHPIGQAAARRVPPAVRGPKPGATDPRRGAHQPGRRTAKDRSPAGRRHVPCSHRALSEQGLGQRRWSNGHGWSWKRESERKDEGARIRDEG